MSAPAPSHPWRLLSDNASTVDFFTSKLPLASLAVFASKEPSMSDRACSQQIVADIHLLANCDAIVMTSSSLSLGRCAAAVGGRPFGLVTSDGQCFAGGEPDQRADVLSPNRNPESQLWDDSMSTCPLPVPPRVCVAYLLVRPSAQDLQNLKYV